MQMWPGRCVSPATLDGVIRSVRQALGDSAVAQDIIATQRGYGYRFVAGVEGYPGGSTDGSGWHPSARVAAPGSVDPGQTDHEEPSLVRTQEPAVMHSTLGAEVSPREVSERPTERAYGQVAIPAAAQHLGRQHSLAGKVVVWAGLALIVIALMLLGTWGLRWEVGQRAALGLDQSRIAVLPFIDLSARATQRYFADGLTQELIAQLAQIDGLTVIDRTSVMKYKGTMKDVATIGRELGVGRILEGSIRTVDNQVRIIAQLIDVASQGHVWSQEYDRELTGVFSLQRDIATRLAEYLRLPSAVVREHRAQLRVQSQASTF